MTVSQDNGSRGNLGHGSTLTAVIAKRLDMPEESILCGWDLPTMMNAITRSFGTCTVGVATPCPSEYLEAVKAANNTVVTIAGPTGFVLPDRQTAARMDLSFDAALLANPGYPTSRLLPQQVLLSYLDACSWVLVDERSIRLTLGGESCAPLTSTRRNLIVARSTGDSRASSQRPTVSYCIAHPETAAALAHFRDVLENTPPENLFSDEEVQHLIADEIEWIEEMGESLDVEIPWLQCSLNLIPGIAVYPAEANYVMCSFSNEGDLDLGVSSLDELEQQLNERGIRIKRLEDIPGLPGNRYFCVMVAPHEENEKLVSTLRKIICNR